MAKHEGIWSEYRPTYWDGWSAVKRMGDLVRCRDCRWYRAPLPSLGNVAMCKRNVVSAIPVDEDGFCAWGERRDA